MSNLKEKLKTYDHMTSGRRCAESRQVDWSELAKRFLAVVERATSKLPDREIQVADFGGGSGRAGLNVKKLLEKMKRRVKLAIIDINRNMLEGVPKMAKSLGFERKLGQQGIHPVERDILSAETEDRYELITISFVTNYLTESENWTLLERAKEHLTQDGILIHHLVYSEQSKESELGRFIFNTVDKALGVERGRIILNKEAQFKLHKENFSEVEIGDEFFFKFNVWEYLNRFNFKGKRKKVEDEISRKIAEYLGEENFKLAENRNFSVGIKHLILVCKK